MKAWYCPCGARETGASCTLCGGSNLNRKTRQIQTMTDRIEVVAAVIRRDNRFLCQQRAPYREYPHTWESPGGKVEGGEGQIRALWRELSEEIDWTVTDTSSPGQIALAPFFQTVFEPPEVGREFRISFFEARANPLWEPKLLDAVGVGWFTLLEMARLDLAPGNRRLIDHLMKHGTDSIKALP